MKKTICLLTKSPFVEEARDAAVAILRNEGFDIQVVEGPVEEAALAKALADAEGLIVRSDWVDAKVLDLAPKLKLVVRAGAGYNNIDVDECTDRGIIVMNTPGKNSNAVAELALGLMLALKRHIVKGDTSTKAGEFLKSKLGGTELMGKKLGIHGMGYIGQHLARKARGCGMRVYALDPWVNPEVAKDCGATLVGDIDDLYRAADVVSVHLPLTDKTRELIDYRVLSLMKDDGILINTARAGVVHDPDLMRILGERPKFRYGADVQPEGDKPGEKAYAAYGDQVILTPHLGASTVEANFNSITSAAKQSAEFFLDGRMNEAINRQVVPFWLKSYAELAEILGDAAASLAEGQPKEIKIICYDELETYTASLARHALKGIYRQANPEWTPLEAYDNATQSGVRLNTTIVPDNSKGHGKSITMDYQVETDGAVKTVSIRGTVAEGIPKISRIDDFRHIDFLPEGSTVIFEYLEREGMIDVIGEYFTREGFNKNQGRFLQNAEGDRAIALFQMTKRNESDPKVNDKLRAIIRKVVESEEDILRGHLLIRPNDKV